MAVFAKAKRVTDPLDRICGGDHRIIGYAGSGREHEANPSCFSHWIHDEKEEEQQDESGSGQSEEESEDPGAYLKIRLSIGNHFSLMNGDRFLHSLLAHVTKSVMSLSDYKTNKSIFHEAVATYLRNAGYDAGICKTKWGASIKVAAGRYEFIDVVTSEGEKFQRYFVDLNFAEQFEIARPSKGYEKLREILPTIFVGKSEDLLKIVSFMSEAAKRSMKTRQLSLPPWRKETYMKMKWLGPYKRTVNESPSSRIFPISWI